ncbi:MAG: sulfatase/phosphatase domain-containing protein, partial [Bacillota bacterium]
DHLKSLLPAAVNRYFSESPDDPKARESILAYYACVSFMDAQVGLVLDTLDRLKLRDNTIIVFVSDNGFHLGEHGMWGKNTLFEQSTRVPLIIASNQADHKPAACPRVVEFLDIYPTLVDLCSLPMPSKLQGRTLLPLLKDPQAPWDHAAYTILKRGSIMGRSLRTEHFRYTEWDAGQEGTELYDLEKDPRELRNVATDPAYATSKAQLQEQLHKRTELTPTQPAQKTKSTAHHPRKSKRLRPRLLWAAGSALAVTLAALGSLYWFTRRRQPH